jgi:hypothetical protein
MTRPHPQAVRVFEMMNAAVKQHRPLSGQLVRMDRMPSANSYAMVNRPAMLLWGLEQQKWPPASSGSCSVQLITRNRMLFQRNPVGGSN